MIKQIIGSPRPRQLLIAGLVSGTLTAFYTASAPRSLASPMTPSMARQFGQLRRTGAISNGPVTAKPERKSTQPAKPATPAKAEERVELQHSSPMVAMPGAWQTWSNVISIVPGMEKMPLYFVVENGADRTAKFQDVRILLAQKPFLTIREFGANSMVSRNLKGTLPIGNTSIIVQGFGPAGAKLVWRLSTSKLTVSAVKPNPFSLKDNVTIEGGTLPGDAKNLKVYIANKPVPVVNGPKKELQLQLPPDLPGGKQDLIAVVGPLKSDPFKVTIKAAPHVDSVDYVSTAPLQPVSISGKGFSTTASENVVSFGGVNATVTAATDTTINCIVPDLPAPQWYVPIIVTTNGMASTEKVTINLGQRVIPNDGNPEQ